MLEAIWPIRIDTSPRERANSTPQGRTARANTPAARASSGVGKAGSAICSAVAAVPPGPFTRRM